MSLFKENVLLAKAQLFTSLLLCFSPINYQTPAVGTATIQSHKSAGDVRNKNHVTQQESESHDKEEWFNVVALGSSTTD